MTIEVFPGHLSLIPRFEKVISFLQNDNQKSAPFSIMEPESVVPGWPVKLFLDMCVWFLDFKKFFRIIKKNIPKSATFSIKEPESVVPGWPVKFSRDICAWFLDFKKLFRIICLTIRKAHLSRSRNQNQLFRDDQWSFPGTSASDSLIIKSYFGLSFWQSEKRTFLDQGIRIICSGMTSEVFPGHLHLILWFE